MHELGTPHRALALEDRPARSPGHGEARVRIEAVGLNFADLLVCAGRYQERPAPPFCPGFEAAGTVVEVGDRSRLGPGQRVIVVPELPEGAMQQSLTVPEDQIFPVPDSVPVTTAAVLHVAYTTAHAALHRRAGIRPGETLLVTGGAGGVGSALVQLGKAAGARVVATATGPAKAEACRRSGADAVVDAADADDLPDRLRAVTHGRGADVAVDVVGGDLFDRLRRCLAFEGRLVSVGFAGGAVPAAPVNHLLLRNYSVVGLYLSAYRRENPTLLREIHADLLRLLDEGRIAPVIHAELPFERAADGLQMLADREVIGRVVLRCPGDR